MIERLRQIVGALTLAAVIGAFVYFAWATGEQNTVLAQQAEAADRTEQALCVLRDDLQIRVDAAVQFLKDNPDGIPGIPPQQIQDSIDNQQRTILALSLLHCDEGT